MQAPPIAWERAVFLQYLHRYECRKQMLAWMLGNLIRILIQCNSKYSCHNSVLWTILWICSRWKFTSLPSLFPQMGNQTVCSLGWFFPCLPLVFCWLLSYIFWLFCNWKNPSLPEILLTLYYLHLQLLVLYYFVLGERAEWQLGFLEGFGGGFFVWSKSGHISELEWGNDSGVWFFLQLYKLMWVDATIVSFLWELIIKLFMK